MNNARYTVHIEDRIVLETETLEDAQAHYEQHVCPTCREYAMSADFMHCMIYDLWDDRILHVLEITPANDPVFAVFATQCLECGSEFFDLGYEPLCYSCKYDEVA